MSTIDVAHDIKVLSNSIIPGQLLKLPYRFRYRGQYNDHFGKFFRTYRDLQKKPSIPKHLSPIFKRWNSVKVSRRDKMLLFNTFDRDSRNSNTFRKPLAIRRDQFSFNLWLDTYISHICDFNYFHGRNIIGLPRNVWKLLFLVDRSALEVRDQNKIILVQANFYPFVFNI